MIFSDGECPSCGHERLCLNTGDFLECPRCHLVCANTDGVLLTVMPFLGNGTFRFDDGELPKIVGVGFAKASGSSCLADAQAIFWTQDELRDYVKGLQPTKAAKEEAHVLWDRFSAEFVRRVCSIDPDELLVAWMSLPARTQFYKEVVMPQVASTLKLKPRNEEFKVDYVMSHVTLNDTYVPKIFIESENSIDTANQEIRKLCSLNSPLRVLVTVRDGWKDLNPDGKGYGRLRDWHVTIRDHAKENKQHFKGIIGIIIGSLVKKKLIYRSCAFDANGELIAPLLKMTEVG
jgi:hypothetical protein